MTRAIIFDLDNCLSAADEPGKGLVEPVFDAIRQESKIKALGFERLFTAIYVDAIDEADRKGKQRTFEEILHVYQLRPEAVLVVGDNPDSEIEAGNRLGIPTVQVLRPGVPRGHNATHHIHGLAELKGLLRQHEGVP